MIKKAFEKIDGNGNGVLELDDIREKYNARFHPDVVANKKTEDEILQEFLETFEVHRQCSRSDEASVKGDGKVTFNEFCDYYSNVSASIDNDQYFELMMTNAWNLNNESFGKAWSGEY